MIQKHGTGRAHGRRELSLEHVETELIDLTDVSLAGLRNYDATDLAPSLARLMHQIERPRANLGGTNPPGRID
ncbi:MAG TPA: hypothetical protein VGM10_02690 [Actinocrinis sp.]